MGSRAADTVRLELLIDGRRQPAASGRTYTSVDPFTRSGWAEVPDAGPTDVDRAVEAARAALQGPWSGLTPTARGRLLRRLGELVVRDADELAELESRDNGKLLREMSGQCEAIADWFEYFAGLADKVQGDVIPVDKPEYLVYTRQEPVGVVAAIVPWNSPLLLLAWKLAPALAAGCTVVAKPSDHTPVSTLRFVELFEEAGFPPGVVNVVTGWGPAVGQALSTHPGVDHIAFTGSTAVGKLIGRAAAGNLTRTTLELGGKSAQIVFPDADLDAAVNGILAGVFAATGQTCMAGSRLLLHRRIADEVVQRVVRRAGEIRIGDPLDPETQMGPLATAQQFETVMKHLASARQEGAMFACGGGEVAGLNGYFVAPTVLTDVIPEMRCVREEIFGPVATVVAFDDEDEAIDIANDTEFGLAGSVWTNDIRRGHRVAAALRAGSVWINAYRVVAPQVPFGGIGQSGIGRENGIDAIRAYTETKAIWVELTGETRDPFTLG